MKSEKKSQNVVIKNITKLSSLLILVAWIGFVVYYAVNFGGSINDQSSATHNLAWGYLANAIAPLAVALIVIFGKAGPWYALARSAFYLSIYYWLMALFSVTLPFIVDVRSSLLYYLAPSALGAAVTVVIYVLAKRGAPIDRWIAPVFSIVTLVAMLIALVSYVTK